MDMTTLENPQKMDAMVMLEGSTNMDRRRLRWRRARRSSGLRRGRMGAVSHIRDQPGPEGYPGCSGGRLEAGGGDRMGSRGNCPDSAAPRSGTRERGTFSP